MSQRYYYCLFSGCRFSAPARHDTAIRQERSHPHADSGPQQDVHRHRRGARGHPEHGHRCQGTPDELAEVWERLCCAAERFYPPWNVDSERHDHPVRRWNYHYCRKFVDFSLISKDWRLVIPQACLSHSLASDCHSATRKMASEILFV